MNDDDGNMNSDDVFGEDNVVENSFMMTNWW